MKSVILVIDVQKGLFDADPRPYEADELMQRINGLTRRARDNAVPVIFIQQEVPGFLEFGSDAWQLHPGLEMGDGDLVLRKSASDAFLRTDLQDKLGTMDVTDLIICGYASEFCVDTTTRRATALGYTVQLVSDAHTTLDKPHLSARQIREHHNITLSMSPVIRAVPSLEIDLGPA